MIRETTPPTLIAEGSRFRGDLSFFSESFVFGIVEGDIFQQSQETLRIGRSGWVHGTIVSQGPLFVEGKVEGNIRCSDTVHLLPTAHVTGEIVSPRLEVRGGARIDGRIAPNTNA